MKAREQQPGAAAARDVGGERRVPRFAAAEVEVERRGDGAMVLRSPQELGATARRVGDKLAGWASWMPHRVFLAEREGEGWRRVTYHEAHEAAQAIGQALLNRGLGPERPLLILSDNSIDHALMALGAMYVGVPAAPVSTAYSLVSRDFAKLRSVAEQLTPGLVFADDGARYAAALDIAQGIGRRDRRVAQRARRDRRDLDRRDARDAAAPGARPTPSTASGRTRWRRSSSPRARPAIPRASSTRSACCARTRRRAARCGRSSPTGRRSCSTGCRGATRSAATTISISCCSTAARSTSTTASRRPPSSRAPPPICATCRRRSISTCRAAMRCCSTISSSDAQLARSFFAELDLLCYAGAALPQSLWERIDALALATIGRKPTLVSAWGTTETAPASTHVHYALERAGNVGLPLPGTEVKLVPDGDKLEVRVRGPNVTPGYWRRPDLTGRSVRRGGVLPPRRRHALRRSRRARRAASSSTAASARISSSPPARGFRSARCASPRSPRPRR